MMFCMAALALMAAACNQKEEYIPEQPVKGVPFTATVTAESISSKALTDNTTTLGFNWVEDETLALIYEVGGTPYNTTATVASVDGSGTATITATLEDGVTNNTPVSIVYPASAVSGTSDTILESVITTQNGALAGRDIRKGSGTIKVTSGTASLAGGATLTAQYAICKFEIEDVDGSNSLPVTSLVIKDASDNIITTVTPASDASTLYVTLPATTGTLWFEAVSSGAPYVAKGTASLAAGNFYHPTMRMATIFNIIGADGKFYKDKASAVTASTTAAAIIAYLGNDTAETGYTHGLAIAMRNAAVQPSGMTPAWRSSGSGTDNTAQYTVASGAITAKESGRTISLSHDSATYPAFQCALNNTITAEDGFSSSAPSFTSGWFLPSLFQWNQIIKALCGESTDLDITTNASLKGDVFNTRLASAGSSNSQISASYIWLSTEYTSTNAWCYTQSSGSVNNSQLKTYGIAVRATLAF